VIELERGLGVTVAGKILSVHDQMSGKPSLFIVDEGAARAKSFRQILFTKGAIRVLKVNAGGLSDIGETDIDGCRLRMGAGVPRQTDKSEQKRYQPCYARVHCPPPFAGSGLPVDSACTGGTKVRWRGLGGRCKLSEMSVGSGTEFVFVDRLSLVVVMRMALAIWSGERLRRFVGLKAQIQLLLVLGLFDDAPWH